MTSLIAVKTTKITGLEFFYGLKYDLHPADEPGLWSCYKHEQIDYVFVTFHIVLWGGDELTEGTESHQNKDKWSNFTAKL